MTRRRFKCLSCEGWVDVVEHPQGLGLDYYMVTPGNVTRIEVDMRHGPEPLATADAACRWFHDALADEVKREMDARLRHVEASLRQMMTNP